MLTTVRQTHQGARPGNAQGHALAPIGHRTNNNVDAVHTAGSWLSQVGATLGVAVMGAAVAAGTGWALLLSAAVCTVGWFVFAVARRAETTG
jgi:hypothetical protein